MYGAIVRQWFVPIDLGIISEKIRIKMVRTAEAMPKNSLPKTFTACAPTPAAPIVLAMVLMESMAAIDLSERSLSRFIMRPPLLWVAIVSVKDVVVESNTDSISEQRKEIPKAKNK